MSIGIYKITNPKNKIYVGQSINIEKRFEDYKRIIRCKRQKKLYYSLLKYSPDSHIFEILEECEKKELNKRERYWQDYYDVINCGLNLILTSTDDKTCEVSLETRSKIKKSLRSYFDSLSTSEKSLIYGKSSIKRRGIQGNRKGYCKTSSGFIWRYKNE